MVCFCSGLLIRRNELQNRNLHFDRKSETRRSNFGIFVSGKQRATPVLTQKVSISTNRWVGVCPPPEMAFCGGEPQESTQSGKETLELIEYLATLAQPLS